MNPMFKITLTHFYILCSTLIYTAHHK